MQLDDIYKLLHQAALGSGHAVADAEAARAALLEEVGRVGRTGAGPVEPMLDPISPDGRLVRVHLRDYLRVGGDIDKLAAAFVATARDWPPARDKLERFCGCVGDFAASGEIAFDAAQVRAYFAHIAQAGYPAVRHSPIYRETYRPAYRVIDRDLLELPD